MWVKPGRADGADGSSLKWARASLTVAPDARKARLGGDRFRTFLPDVGGTVSHWQHDHRSAFGYRDQLAHGALGGTCGSLDDG